MTFKLYDVVAATSAFPEFGIRSGMTGAIVDVYTDGEVEVEFCDKNGETIALIPLQSTQISFADIL